MNENDNDFTKFGIDIFNIPKDTFKSNSFDDAAKTIKELYDSFVKAGFDDKKAFLLVNTILTLTMQGTLKERKSE